MRGALSPPATFLLGSVLALQGCPSETAGSHSRDQVTPQLERQLVPTIGGQLRGLPVHRAARELTWNLGDMPLGPALAVVSIPAAPDPTTRFPVLIALHGRGEARKTPEQGARGWLEDYGAYRAIERLQAPPLTEADFEGMVTRARLAQINRSLEQRPYRGLILVCPYLPDRFRGKAAHGDAQAFASYLVNQLLPRVYHQTAAQPGPAHLGIDGVSLGGRASLFTALEASPHFGAVGGIQPALDHSELSLLARGFADMASRHPELRLRLLSSKKDYFLAETRGLSRKLHRHGYKHGFNVLEGDHSYRFSRGPGVYELLLYYDRVLRAEPYL